VTKREFVVTFDTEKDADILAFWDALPEPHKSRVFVLIMRARMYQEALDKAGLWLDVDGEVER